jgi:hypothetical protein
MDREFAKRVKKHEELKEQLTRMFVFADIMLLFIVLWKIFAAIGGL